MPKSISASVGSAGANVASDAATVQYLLNCVPASDGGPDPELAVDGIAGPLTIGAITCFQNTQLGWADGRVDPRGQTLPLLQAYDPYPQVSLGPLWGGKGSKSGGKGMGKHGSKSMGKHGGKSMGNLGGKGHGKYGGKHGGKHAGKAGSGIGGMMEGLFGKGGYPGGKGAGKAGSGIGGMMEGLFGKGGYPAGKGVGKAGSGIGGMMEGLFGKGGYPAGKGAGKMIGGKWYTGQEDDYGMPGPGGGYKKTGKW